MNRLRRLVATTLMLASFAAQAQAGAKARAETEALARAALPAAQEMLLAHGEFAPFGMGMAAGDEVVDIKNSTPGTERAEPADPVSVLRRSLAEALRQGSVRATALVYEARLEVKGSQGSADAIAMALAHRDGYAAIVVYPYEFRDGRIALGEPHLIEQKPLPKAPQKRRR